MENNDMIVKKNVMKIAEEEFEAAIVDENGEFIENVTVNEGDEYFLIFENWTQYYQLAKYKGQTIEFSIYDN